MQECISPPYTLLICTEHVFHPPPPHTHTTHCHKVGVLCVPHGHNGVNLFNQLLFLVILEVHVPLSQPRLTRAILNQYEPDLHRETKLYQLLLNLNIRASKKCFSTRKNMAGALKVLSVCEVHL